MKKVYKTIVICVSIFAIIINNMIFVSAHGPLYEYSEEGGETIYYFIDDNGHPYCMENGKKIYLALPLSQFRITDTKLLTELNEIVDSETQTRAAPTYYYELALKEDETEASHSFIQYYSFENQASHTTTFLKMSSKHSKIVFRTKNVEVGFLENDNVDFTYRFYNSYLNVWSEVTYTDEDCTSIFGCRIGYLTTTTFSQFVLYEPEDFKSYTAVIWTIEG